jgi:2-methylcitrate dehydratase
VKIYFQDGTSTNEVVIEYPIGHQRRREEGVPLLYQKFANNLSTRLPKHRAENIEKLFDNTNTVLDMSVAELMNLFVI